MAQLLHTIFPLAILMPSPFGTICICKIDATFLLAKMIPIKQCSLFLIFLAWFAFANLMPTSYAQLPIICGLQKCL
jgi:hypothetical protein